MAICSALTGAIAKTCDTNTGGVRKIWITDWSQLTLTLDVNGKVTNLTPSGPNQVITTNATVNTVVSGPIRRLSTVTVPGDQTSILTSGKWFYFTYNVMAMDGVTVTATFWSGQVLLSTYDTVNNVTVITPDFVFIPLVGQSADPAPPNTNQTVSTYAFFEFAFNRNVSSFEENAMVNLENQSTFFDQKVNLMLQRRETTKRDAIEKLVAGQKQLLTIVLDSNGLYWLLGSDSGLYATEITGGSGVTKSDKNGYAIVLTAEEAIQALEVNASALSLFLINAI